MLAAKELNSSTHSKLEKLLGKEYFAHPDPTHRKGYYNERLVDLCLQTCNKYSISEENIKAILGEIITRDEFSSFKALDREYRNSSDVIASKYLNLIITNIEKDIYPYVKPEIQKLLIEETNKQLEGPGKFSAKEMDKKNKDKGKEGCMIM